MFNLTCITHWGLAFALFVSASSVLSTAAQNAPVYIDDSPAAADQIIEATRLRSQNRLTESATKYQHILETYRHKLIKTDKPYHTDTRRLIVSRLLADEPLLTIYRTQYEASAKRLLKQADSASNRQAALLAVVDRYYLCPSALQAGLDAVGLLLEKADFLAAHALLEQLAPHPDHKQHLTRYHALMSACLLLQNNLKHPLDPQALKTMGLSTARLAPPITLPWSSIYKSGWAIPNLPANITELWNIPLNNPFSSEDANTRRHRFRRQVGQNPPQSPLDGNLIPVIQADLLFVNHQQGINAYDRLSGRPLWEYSLTQQQPTNNSMMSGSILDKNRSVCLTENRVLGVVGFMSQWRSAWKLKNYQTHLVCLDMHTGKQLWKTQPPALDESLQEVFFHGTPLADDRRVYVLMRRSQNSGFHTAYLAALNITDGTLIWKRHLASAAMSNHNPFYALGKMTLKQGQIYVTDNLGTLSAIDGLTGDMLWMYMLDRNQESQTIQSKSRITQRTHSTITARRPAPIVTSKQVLIAPAWANEPALLLDRLTGNPVRKLDTKGFDPTCQLAMTPAGLLSISQTVRLFDSQTFTQKWEQKLNNLTPEQYTQFLVHDKQVLVQTNNQLVTLNLEDGNILNRHPFNQQGIILTANKQWIISRGNELISLMHWDDAYAQLSNRIHRHPNEVWPGLALSHIASMRKQWATVLQGIDAAIDTIPLQNFASPASSVQQHKIQQIFNYIREHVELPAQGDKDPHFAQAQLQSMPDPSTMQALFERLAVVSITPVNEVAQQFARGRYWQYLGKGARAIEHYQSVLEDPTLLGQLYQFDQGARQARLEARLRLIGIITADPQAMIHFETVATEHLHQLQRTNTATAQNYLALAESYPLTQAAATARMTAAKQYWQQGQIELAVTQLQQAYPRANTLGLKQQLAGKLAQGYQQLNNPAKAHRVLNTFALLFPNQPVWRNNQWVSVDPWISELALLVPTQSGSPKFNLPLKQVIGLEGRLLLPTHHAPNVHSRQLVLLHDNSLFLYQLNQQRMLWSFPLEDPQTQLLAQSTNQLLLWQPTLGKLQSINTHTGQPLWAPIKLNQQIQEVAIHPDRLAREPDVQRQWMQMMNPNGLMVVKGRIREAKHQVDLTVRMIVSPQILIAADGAGRVLAIDRETGIILWKRLYALDMLQYMAIHDQYLAIGGTVGLPNDTQSHKLLVVDLSTGDSVMHPLEEKDALQWLGLVGPDMLISVTADLVAAHRIGTGEVVWRLPNPGTLLLDANNKNSDMSHLPNHVLFKNSQGIFTSLNLTTGQTTGAWLGNNITNTPNTLQLQLKTTDDRYLLLTPTGLTSHDHQGKMLWRDAINTATQYLLNMQLGHKQIVLLTRRNQDWNNRDAHDDMIDEQPMLIPNLPQRGIMDPLANREEDDPLKDADGHYRYQILLLDPESGRITHEQSLPAMSMPILPQATLLCDDNLILSTHKQTLIIPSN